MPQVQGVGHQPTGRVGVDPTGDRQLDQTQLLHPRRPVPTDVDQPILTTPLPPITRTQLRIRRMQIGPVRRQRQIPSLRPTPRHQLVLDRRQRRRRVEVLEVEGVGKVVIHDADASRDH